MKKEIRLYIVIMLMTALAACTMQPARQSGQNESIRDAYWLLVSLEGQDMQTPTDTRTAYIRFEENENDVNGFTGCNRFFGKYELSGSALRMSRLGSTRMMCPNLETERKMMDALERTDSYSISGDLLTLYTSGKAVATFRTGQRSDIDEGADLPRP